MPGDLEAQVAACRARWEPFIEDSTGATVGGYLPHDKCCTRCKPLIAALERIAELETALQVEREWRQRTTSASFATSLVDLCDTNGEKP